MVQVVTLEALIRTRAIERDRQLVRNAIAAIELLRVWTGDTKIEFKVTHHTSAGKQQASLSVPWSDAIFQVESFVRANRVMRVGDDAVRNFLVDHERIATAMENLRETSSE